MLGFVILLDAKFDPLDFLIKKAEIEDLDKALALLKIAALRLQSMEVDQWAYWLNPPAYKMKWLLEGFEQGAYYFVYMHDMLAAMYRLSNEDLEYWGRRRDQAWYIHSLVVLPDFVGQGLGYKIMDKIEAEAKALNIPKLRLDCHAYNFKLCAYYQKFGFEEVGEVEMPHSLNKLFEKLL